MRAVIDTSVIVSALLRRHSTPGEVLRALRNNRFSIVYSTDILVEVIDVLGRPKFREKYHIRPEDISHLINLIRLRGELVRITETLSICRDPKDDKFLEAAKTGEADCIVSGDSDLLVLHPFGEIAILRPAEFLALL